MTREDDQLWAAMGPDVMQAALAVIEAARALHALPPYTEAQGYLDALEDALAAWDAVERQEG